MATEFVCTYMGLEPDYRGASKDAMFRPASHIPATGLSDLSSRIAALTQGALPALTAEEAAEKFSELKRTGCPALREELIRRNMLLVPYLCARIKPDEPEAWEVKVLGGLEGLITAVDNFDPDLGYKFSSYALYWIRNKAQERYWSENSNTVYGPGHWASQRFAMFERIRGGLEQKLQRAVSDREVIDHVEENDIRLNGNTRWWIMLENSGSPEEWNASCPEERNIEGNQRGGGLLQAGAGLHEDPTAEEDLNMAAQADLVEEFMAELTPEHREIIDKRFGLTTGYPLTLNEIVAEKMAAEGKRYTRQGLSLREHTAIKRLQKMAAHRSVSRRLEGVLS